jgi:hypothetical protein
MGWASAGPIFDRTARALLDSGAEDRIVTEVLAALTEALTDGDWDSLDESLEQFEGSPAVVAGLKRGAPRWFGAPERHDGADE